MYLLIQLAYEEYIDVIEGLRVFWIMVNIIKYYYYCQNAKYDIWGCYIK